jgi:uncharacterized membrane protein
MIFSGLELYKKGDNNMIDRANLKQTAKNQMKGKWGQGALFTLVYMIIVLGISGFSNIKFIGAVFGLASIVINPPIFLGLYLSFIILVKENGNLEVGNLFKGFDQFARSLAIYWWQFLWIFLWTLVLVVPGIIKSLAYSQAMFIVADNPKVGVRDAIKISIKMTEGYKGEIFVMCLSFLGWILLGILSLFIGFLWITPYMFTTYTNLFYKLKETSIQNGKCTEEMFNGTVKLVS